MGDSAEAAAMRRSVIMVSTAGITAKVSSMRAASEACTVRDSSETASVRSLIMSTAGISAKVSTMRRATGASSVNVMDLDVLNLVSSMASTVTSVSTTTAQESTGQALSETTAAMSVMLLMVMMIVMMFLVVVLHMHLLVVMLVMGLGQMNADVHTEFESESGF